MDALNGRQYDGRDLRITMDAGRPSRLVSFSSGSGLNPESIGLSKIQIRDPKPQERSIWFCEFLYHFLVGS